MTYDLKITYNDGTEQTVFRVTTISHQKDTKKIEELLGSAWFSPSDATYEIYSEDGSASVQLFSHDVRSLYFYASRN